MTDYPAAWGASNYYDGATNNDTGWHSDDNPATWLTLPTSTEGRWEFAALGDLTGNPGIVGWRVDLDIVSGAGQLYLNVGFNQPGSMSDYDAFEAYFDVAGPGMVSHEFVLPYTHVGDDPYAGPYLLLQRLAAGSGPWVEGSLQATYTDGGPDIVISGARIVFFTQDLDCVVETFDGGAVGAAVTTGNTALTFISGDWEFTAAGRDGQGAETLTGGRVYMAGGDQAAAVNASVDWHPSGALSMSDTLGALELFTGPPDDADLVWAMQGYYDGSFYFIASSDDDFVFSDPVAVSEQWFRVTGTLYQDRVTLTVHDEAGALVFAAPWFPAGGLQVCAVASTTNGYNFKVDNLRLCGVVAAVVRVLRRFPRHDAKGFGSTGRNYPRPSGWRNVGGMP